MRATIKQAIDGIVTLTYDDPLLERRVSMEFFCPPRGGYVRMWTADGRHPQICDKLAWTGSALMCASGADLLHVIRREYRAMKRDEAKQM